MNITQHKKERPGTSRQEDHQAALNSDTHEGALTMTDRTFTPGDQEHTTATTTDIDGEVYQGETIKLKGARSIPNGESEDAKLYIYTVYQDTRAAELEISEGSRLLFVDPMGHDAWIDVNASEMHALGRWLISEAEKPQAGN